MKEVSPRCSRWSQVCRSAGHVADTVLMRKNWQGARLSRRSVPGEKNKHGQFLGFTKERGMSSLSLAKKGRLAERWNGDQREREKKGAKMAEKRRESVRLKGEGKLVCRGKVLAEEGAVTNVRGRALGLKVCWGKQQ
uniref:Uncharacterized protein n=1 Tax=Populus alba TaxID=43335 RepID=A0A4V6AAW5_POPAL|nr:hypothetical protein D5086_0000062110 [Populus alba]